MDELYQLSLQFLHARNQNYRRYFIRDNSLNEKMSILVGQRGVGKTTLLIQYLLDFVDGNLASKKILYVPSDHFSLGNRSLYSITETFVLNGGEFIAFDEIHKVPNWSISLKSIYDSFPKLKVLASGSSALEIHRGSHDLSRRAIVYRVFGLSFREYLEMELELDLPQVDFDDLLVNHQDLCLKTCSLIENKKKHKILVLFQNYLKHGFYPYWFEWKDEDKFQITLEQSIHTTLESDLIAIHPSLSGISIKKIRALLAFIAQNVPYSPNWKNLCQLIEIGDERTLKNYFTLLDDADLIKLLYSSSSKLSGIDSPAKIYLQNTNIAHVIACGRENKGNLRETFLFNMLARKHEVTLPSNGDFLVDRKFLIEVGGAKKSKKQIWNESKAYVVADDIEIGMNNKIPLWLFGFL
jgi:hypothetical protein